MARSNIRVPFGYVEPKAKVKGTLFVFDLFNDWQEVNVDKLFQLANERAFAKVVLVPQHEETAKRMKLTCDTPYFERVKNLQRMIESLEIQTPYVIDQWEGKRKKYTPMDTLLRFLVDKYQGPYFICMNEWYANVFASTSEFDSWIKRLRLLIEPRHGVPLHAKLSQAVERWDETRLFE